MKSHTQDFSSFFSQQSQQKNPQNGDFSLNSNWQSKNLDSHTKMKAFVKRMVGIIDKYIYIIEKVDFKLLN